MKDPRLLAFSLVLAFGGICGSPVSAVDWTIMDHCKRNADRLNNQVRLEELRKRTSTPEKPTDPQAVKFSDSDKAALDELTRNCEARDRERAMEKNREIQAKSMALRKRLEEIRLRDEQQVAQAKQLRKTGKTSQAVKYLEQLCTRGSAGAPYMLGSMYMAGDGVKQDKKQAVSWFYKAARNGSSEGAVALARAYFQGDGVAQDYKQSVNWLKVSQHPSAQHLLGTMLEEGFVCDKNYGKAWDAFKEAASQNYPPAQAALGEMCYFGLGMRHNVLEAKKWFDDAALGGDAKGFFYLSKMYADGEGVQKNPETSEFLFSKYKEASSKVKPQNSMEQKLTFKDYGDLNQRFERLSQANPPAAKPEALPPAKTDNTDAVPGK